MSNIEQHYIEWIKDFENFNSVFVIDDKHFKGMLKFAESYASLKVEEVLEQIEKSLPSDEEIRKNINNPSHDFYSEGVYDGTMTQKNKTQEAINKLKKG